MDLEIKYYKHALAMAEFANDQYHTGYYTGILKTLKTLKNNTYGDDKPCGMTNGDKIRAMNDVELAEYLANQCTKCTDCGYRDGDCDCNVDICQSDVCAQWISSPAQSADTK